MSRRSFSIAFLVIAAITTAACFISVIKPAVAQSDDVIVATLLGTGNPIPDIDRFGPSILIEAGGSKLLFDAGRGAPMRLAQLNIPLGKLDAVFITHLHSDHTAGLPDIWLTGFLPMQYGLRVTPLRVYGPPGTTKLTEALQTAFETDTKLRVRVDPNGKTATQMIGEEFNEDKVVYDAGGVKVFAFRVDHGPGIDAFGFRVDFKGRSVTLSGDTRPNDNLVKHAAKTDLLIHEVFAASPALRENKVFAAIEKNHTVPQQAGDVFNRATPKLAVYSHIVLFGTQQVPAPSADEIARQTREVYQGPLVVGNDLDRFVIGQNVEAKRWDSAGNRYRDLKW